MSQAYLSRLLQDFAAACDPTVNESVAVVVQGDVVSRGEGSGRISQMVKMTFKWVWGL